MVTGWRRAFCTSVPRSQETETQSLPSPSPSPKSCGKFGVFSNPSTPRLQSPAVASPRLRCRTGATSALTDGSPRLICKTTETSKSPRVVCQPQNSNPSSPKSPSRFALFKSPRSRLSKRSCGICLQSVKTGQGAAIFTSECSHSFHFTCITAHVANKSCLVCPVCNAAWQELSLLAIHKEGSHENEVEKKMPSMGFKYSASKSGSDIRLYDDDEPLVSPRFNPIPEAEEGNEEEEEIGEFHGFFANPAPSAEGGELVSVVEGTLLPEAAVVSVGRSHESYAVVLRVKTPGLSDRTPRASVDLVAVLDVSESVSGAKLHTLRRAMKLIVASLGSADRLSIVAFSAGPKRLLPLRRMTPHGQRAASRIVDRLGPGNGRCVAEALGKAGKVLEDRRERNPVASIFLLSDGHDEQGNSISINRSRSISFASTSRFTHLGIHVQAFGFGHGSESSSYEAFAKSLSELLSVVVQDLRVNIGFPSGEIFAVYSAIGRPALLGSCSSSGSIKAGDLNAEEERDLLLELRVPSAAAGSHHVLSVGFSYKNPATREIVHNKEQPLLIPRPHAVRSSDPKIQRLRNVFVSARAVAEARRMVERNDMDGAHRVLASARGLILQSTSRSADADVRSLEAELAELHSRRQKNSHLQSQQLDNLRRRSERNRTSVGTEPLTPTSAWRYAEQLAKVAIMRKSMNRVSDLHGFENARF